MDAREGRRGTGEVPKEQCDGEPAGDEIGQCIHGAHGVKATNAFFGEGKEEVAAHEAKLVFNDVGPEAEGDDGAEHPGGVEPLAVDESGDKPGDGTREEAHSEAVRPTAVPRDELDVHAVWFWDKGVAGAAEDGYGGDGVVVLEELAIDGCGGGAISGGFGARDGNFAGIDDRADYNVNGLVLRVEGDLILAPEVGAQFDGLEVQSDRAIFLARAFDVTSHDVGDFLWIGLLSGFIEGVILVEEAIELKIERVGEEAEDTAPQENEGCVVDSVLSGAGDARSDGSCGDEVGEAFHVSSIRGGARAGGRSQPFRW